MLLLAFFSWTLFGQDAAPVGRGLRFRPWLPPEGFAVVAVNDNGDIAGNHREMGPMLMTGDGIVRDLGLAGSTVAAMNNNRQMVINGPDGVFLRHPDGVLEPRRVEDSAAVTGYGINNLGQIAGQADTRSVVWNADGTYRVIPAPLILPGRREPVASARAVNDEGTVVGEYDLGADLQHVIYRLTKGVLFESMGVARLGAFGVGLNNAGDIAYSASDAFGLRTTLIASTGGLRYADSGASGGSVRITGALSPDGRTIVGSGYVAETCPVRILTVPEMVPFEGGVIRVEARADADCEWYYRDSRRSGDAAWDVRIASSTTPRVNHLDIAGADIAILQGDGAPCEYSLVGTPIFPTTLPVPGSSAYAPVSGATLRIPFAASAGCPGMFRAALTGSTPNRTPVQGRAVSCSPWIRTPVPIRAAHLFLLAGEASPLPNLEQLALIVRAFLPSWALVRELCLFA